jgi:predicted nucleotidyltransferase
MIQLQDYENALKQFLDVASRLGDTMSSVIEYGSVVKGTARPGASDILDAVVILRDTALASEAEYYAALNVLTEACATISDIGIPFHPVHYFIMDDGGWSTTAQFLPAWTSDEDSRVVAGEDVRPRLFTHDVDGEFMRGWYCQRYWALQRAALAIKLGARAPGRPAPDVDDLLRILRDLPQFACLACGVLVDRDRAVAEIMRLVPDADLAMLPQLCDRSAADTHHGDAHVLVERILEVNDELYRAVSQRMFEDVRT